MDAEFIFINDVGPRDGLQNQTAHIEPQERVRLIKALLAAGLAGVEVASFVNPKAVPRMAGADKIMHALKGEKAALSCLIPNMKGYELAHAAGAKIISVVPSASETMNQKNINMSYEEIMRLSCEILQRAKEDGVRGQAYISVAFECPFEGLIAQERVMDMATQLLGAGAQEIIIADTIGAAHPAQVKNLFSHLADEFDIGLVSAHFHDTRALGLANTFAALECGVRKFDASIGGLGGCPFAPGAAGNLATEDVVSMVHQMGFATGIDEDKLQIASALAGTLIGAPVGGRMAGWMASRKEKQAQAHS